MILYFSFCFATSPETTQGLFLRMLWSRGLIPYFQIPDLALFGLKFHFFGFMVALGFILGASLAAKRAREKGLSARAINDVAILCLIFGILGAHVVAVLGENPSQLWSEPWRSLEVRSGLSSYGGLIGAGIAVAIYFRRKDLPFLPYADAIMFGLLPGWTLGRIGCFGVHDHPGRLSTSFLAVRFPGGARHDLGLYEAILTLLISGVLYWLGRRQQPRGFFFTILLFMYPIPRFFLDYLRAFDLADSNPRYGGLTFPQYGSIALVLWGVYLLRQIRGTRRA